VVVGLLGNESPDSNRFTPVTPKSENDVRLQARLGNQNPTGLPVGAVRVALTRYEQDTAACFEMLNFLKGPEPLSEFEKQFLKDRLSGATYKTMSFFDGAIPGNNYQPTVPYTLKVSENPYSFDNENWAVMYVTSGGADSPRPIKLRKKPSTGQWFLNEIQCLSDIRTPVAADPWA